jgi:hypothetical protein
MNRDGDSKVTPPERQRVDEIARWGQQDPSAAIDYLKACLDGDHGSVEPGQRVEFWLLLAELYAIFGDLIQARARCARAVFEMNRLAEPDAQLVLACLAVAADIAVQSGDGTAPTACFAYMRQTAHDATSSDPSRLVLAGALMAIAEYHQQDCATAKTRLDTLMQRAPDGPLGRMLAAAAAAMEHGCAYPGGRERGPVKPFPGVILQPLGELPDEDALADRVRQHPGVHTRHQQGVDQDPTTLRWRP